MYVCMYVCVCVCVCVLYAIYSNCQRTEAVDD